ncbi:MAG: phospho-N-acetylmuramoyl-pentapeptide-transferase [Clostridiales bacterium]|jgi:phospho-N-acetylmuramoyl-pentapeptide-transferase|nr:phospho-N-acetylmuramoyl-pentapeptide-transferase [Clostridiales bacterium]
MDITGMTVLIVSALAAFLLAALLGKLMIPMLHRLKFGQVIRDEGPSWHKKKQGTPTMGGLLFIVSTVAVLLIAWLVCEWFLPLKVSAEMALTRTRMFAGLLMALCCGGIGFLDDYIKVVKKRNLGLTDKQKMFCQLLVGTAYALWLYMAGGTVIEVPFVGQVDMGLWFIPFCVFVIALGTNAVNLTDGVDGLCGTVSFVACLFFVAAAGLVGYFQMGLIAAVFAGSLAGFLMWNLHPAKVFMGDTGSLFIGGVLCALGFGMGRPLLLIPVGIIYLVEAASVILQVGYFKITHGKRLFKMSPIHHHFEMSGWSENRIVTVFSLITLVGAAVSMLLLYV